MKKLFLGPVRSIPDPAWRGPGFKFDFMIVWPEARAIFSAVFHSNVRPLSDRVLTHDHTR